MGQKLSKNHRGNRRTRRKKEKQKRKTAQVGQQSCCSGGRYCAGDVYWNEFLGGAGSGGRVTALSILEQLSVKEKRVLYRETLEPEDPEVKKPKDNAETCKIYRARKKLEKHMKEGGLDD